MEDKKIKAFFIFEILGRPAEYIKEALGKIIDEFERLPGIKVLKKTIYDAKPVEKTKAKDLFTSFAEAEIGADKIEEILLIIFNSLPSHVEILEPAEYRLKNFELSTLLTEITKKLHQYDEIAKTSILEKNALLNKLKEMQGNQIENTKFEIKPENKKTKIKKNESKTSNNKSKKVSKKEK